MAEQVVRKPQSPSELFRASLLNAGRKEQVPVREDVRFTPAPTEGVKLEELKRKLGEGAGRIL